MKRSKISSIYIQICAHLDTQSNIRVLRDHRHQAAALSEIVWSIYLHDQFTRKLPDHESELKLVSVESTVNSLSSISTFA